MRTRLIGALSVLALLVTACSTNPTGGEIEGPPIEIASNDFAESQIVSEIYARALELKGFSVTRKGKVGARPISYAGLKDGQIDLMPEYVASLLEFINENAGEATSDVDETLEILRRRAEPEGLVVLEPAPAIDTNAFATNQQTATEHGLETLSDLQPVAGELALGAPADCPRNPFCIPALEANGIEFRNHDPLEEGPLWDALEENAVQVATVYSTRSIVAARGFVVLEDDLGIFGADYIVPILNGEVADAYGQQLADALNAVSAELSTEEITELNKRVEIDKEDVDDVAFDWLRGNGFLSK